MNAMSANFLEAWTERKYLCCKYLQQLPKVWKLGEEQSDDDKEKLLFQSQPFTQPFPDSRCVQLGQATILSYQCFAVLQFY
jgi:hypothetical protein